MKITNEWLEEKRACQDGVKWFNNQSETDAGKLMTILIEENRTAD